MSGGAALPAPPPVMRLAPFIERNLEPILQEWEAFARTLLPAAGSMDPAALRDHARQILLTVAADMQTAQSPEEQREKSLGAGDQDASQHSAATIHGELRYEVGFDLVQVVAEYRALRASVLRLWTRQAGPTDAEELEDMVRFNEAIDQAVAQSVVKYSAELDTARDTFIAILGHDLRSPLSAILMSAHNVSSTESLPPSAARAMAIIQRGALSMQVMIRDLLDVAGTRLGRRMPLRQQSASLDDTCLAVLAELRAAHPRHVFEYEQTGNLKGTYDPERIGQVLSNLLNNAVNHGDRDRPIAVRASGDNDEELVVEVRNRGKTLTPGTLRAIMDPAARKQLPGNEGSSGLGLGIYIAREIAEAHGGSVNAASENGLTTFSLRLPRRQPPRSAS